MISLFDLSSKNGCGHYITWKTENVFSLKMYCDLASGSGVVYLDVYYCLEDVLKRKPKLYLLFTVLHRYANAISSNWCYFETVKWWCAIIDEMIMLVFSNIH